MFDAIFLRSDVECTIEKVFHVRGLIRLDTVYPRSDRKFSLYLKILRCSKRSA